MNEARHTPGPWIVERIPEKIPSELTVAEGAGPKVICRLGSGGEDVTDELNGDDAATRQLDVDARLIAAAPAMLDALRSVLQFLDELDGCMIDGLDELPTAIRAVIAEATGTGPTSPPADDDREAIQPGDHRYYRRPGEGGPG